MLVKNYVNYITGTLETIKSLNTLSLSRENARRRSLLCIDRP